ncbi:aminoglycoside phosphotransferase family protein [Paenibacillus sp. LHD-38]|uniref:phosphotransferase family protein n=1 Tax=Paenibacillus sp. LHD-38 TaxID=3072143 RepID=UPI00280D3227|nr:aminoglycoside phosphotransferase family protein [Paenibacillus sp. LHD-38]MDQ8738524.1 aminoglycoside phosphotransferase family protein [Paenibacillus sp. LHD-38]
MTVISNQILPDRLLKWVAAAIHPLASVQSITRLHGGMSSIVHSITLEVQAVESKVVLRQFDNAEWLRQEPDLALHEAENLRWAAKTGVPTPQILAFDETGMDCGIPAVLMTQLEGTVDLQPPDMDSWVDGLAKTLAQIHTTEAKDYPWSYFTYNDVPALEAPSWSSFKEDWSKVIALVKGPRPIAKPCFIHRDYHPTNVLWQHNQISGVVDWVNACQGPAGIDIGHCRLNLAQLYGINTADAFLNAYEKHAGSRFQYEPYWDLLSLIDILFGPPSVYPGWPAFGVTGLTDALMIQRLDAYMLSLLDKASGH